MSARAVADRLVESLSSVWQCEVRGEDLRAEVRLSANGRELAVVVIDANRRANPMTQSALYFTDPAHMKVEAYLLTAGGRSEAPPRLFGFLQWALMASGASWVLLEVPSLSELAATQRSLTYRAATRELL